MTSPRELSKTEKLSVDGWVSVISKRWEHLPEFEIDPKKLRHLAVICDGNRRSAKEKGLRSWQGHRLGVEVIRGITRAARDWGIRNLTFWTWSTENWKRDQQQVGFVMNLAAKYLADEGLVQELLDHQARFTHLGRKDRLPTKVKTVIENLERITIGFDRYRLNLALDYGGMDETARGLVKIINAIEAGDLSTEDILSSPQAILGYLDTTGQHLPDLIIRTGVKPDEVPHTSGFLPLQSEYAGWLFLPDLFPDLEPKVLQDAIDGFLGYERRLGR